LKPVDLIKLQKEGERWPPTIAKSAVCEQNMMRNQKQYWEGSGGGTLIFVVEEVKKL